MLRKMNTCAEFVCVKHSQRRRSTIAHQAARAPAQANADANGHATRFFGERRHVDRQAAYSIQLELSTEHGPFRDVARGFGWEPWEAGLVAARQGGRGEPRVSPLCALFGRR